MGARYGSSIGVWKPERNGSTWHRTPSARNARTNSWTAASGPHTIDWRGALSWDRTIPEPSHASASAARTRSADAPTAAKARPGTVSASGSNSAMNVSTWVPEYRPAATMAVHSPTLCPATASGTTPMRRSALSSSRPSPTTE